MKSLLITLPLLAAAPAAAQDFAGTEKALQGHVAYLASDAMRGRDTGSPELTKAELYVAEQLRAVGLKPGGPKGGWLQPVPLLSYRSADHGSLVLIRDGKRVPLEWGKDYLARSNPRDLAIRAAGEVVFAGYGAVDPTTGYDDYKGLDVRGKVVALLRAAPASFANDVRAHLEGADEQARNAAAKGAAAVILIESNDRHGFYPFAEQVGDWDDTALAWAGADGRARAPKAPPFGYLGFDGATKLFAGSPISWDAVHAADVAGKPLPRGPLGVRIEATANSKVEKLSANNVVGVLEGTDLKGEYVVLSAHLDHIGVDAEAKGDQINNGAMDNAAGVASMIEVARAFQRSGKRPRRSLLFVAVTAEEKGLVGSDYFAANPTVPAKQIVADVNLDMPVLTYTFEDVVVYGADRSSIGKILETAAAAQGVKVVPDTQPEEGFFVRSDHYSFVKAGIPAVSFDLGPGGPGKAANKEFSDKHYHQPSDEIGLIDWSQGLRYVKLNYAITRALAEADERPVWNKGDFFGTLYHGPMAK